MAVGQSEASAELPDQIAGQSPQRHGVVVGGEGGTDERREKPKGEKRLRPTFQQHFTRTDETERYDYASDENDCAPFAPGSPTRPTGAAHGSNPKRRRACLLRRRVPKRQAPAEALRDEVATMRARNAMRFSAPTGEPPGGRPSRGAKLKGRGCTRQKDAAVRMLRLGGAGAAKKAPSEQGATKAAGLGAEDARLEPRQWSATERVSRDRRRKRRCCARPPTEKSARSSAFFSIGARYSLAHTKAGARSGDAGNTDFPPRFLLGRLCGGRYPKLHCVCIGLISCCPFRAGCFVICANVLSY